MTQKPEPIRPVPPPPAPEPVDSSRAAESSSTPASPPELDTARLVEIELGMLGPKRRDEPVPPLLAPDDADTMPVAASWTDRVARRETISSGVSTAIHLLVLIVLACWLIPMPPRPVGNELISSPPEDWSKLETFEIEREDPTIIAALDIIEPGPTDAPSVPIDTLLGANQMPTPGVLVPPSHLWQPKDTPLGGGYAGRTTEFRQKLTARQGPGSPSGESESAVERGLAWLAAHQMPDGSWRFDHNHELGFCRGKCRNAGNAATTTGSTGLALLAFLGAGYTHQVGPYQKNVRQGLYYLQQRGRITENGADLQEGTMYGQGIATLALCEAYAMTRDPALRSFAQQAVDFIVYAQNPVDGGWRYHPGQPGDSTVTAWQLMALKSASLGGLGVPQQTIYRAEHFFDTVAFDDGAQYGYNDNKPRARRASTAIGLLCRMYAGWSRAHGPLERGISLLDQWGPDKNDLYYNYYATLALHHYGGSAWRRWDERMQSYLIQTQSFDGHENGSWYFPDEYGDRGGRLYNTCMAIMILEVYYRYMPIYGAGHP